MSYPSGFSGGCPRSDRLHAFTVADFLEEAGQAVAVLRKQMRPEWTA